MFLATYFWRRRDAAVCASVCLCRIFCASTVDSAGASRTPDSQLTPSVNEGRRAITTPWAESERVEKEKTPQTHSHTRAERRTEQRLAGLGGPEGLRGLRRWASGFIRLVPRPPWRVQYLWTLKPLWGEVTSTRANFLFIGAQANAPHHGHRYKTTTVWLSNEERSCC